MKKEKGELKAEISVSEIFSHDLDVISKCFDLLDNNQKFADLAKNYSGRNQNNSYVIILLGAENYPEYWQAVFNLGDGEIYGPVNTD